MSKAPTQQIDRDTIESIAGHAYDQDYIGLAQDAASTVSGLWVLGGLFRFIRRPKVLGLIALAAGGYFFWKSRQDDTANSTIASGS